MYENIGNEIANLLPCNPAGEEGRGKGGQVAQWSTGAETEHGCSGIGFLFCFCHDVEGVTTVVYDNDLCWIRGGNQLWIGPLSQKVVHSSTTLLPIAHPVETYFGFCVARYRQARKLTFFGFLFVQVLSVLGWGFFIWLFFWLCFWFGWGFFVCLFWGEKKHSGCFPLPLVYPSHLSCPSDSDPQTIHWRNAFPGQSPPHPATVCLQGWESNSFSVPALTGQSSWQDVSAYCS